MPIYKHGTRVTCKSCIKQNEKAKRGLQSVAEMLNYCHEFKACGLHYLMYTVNSLIVLILFCLTNLTSNKLITIETDSPIRLFT